MFSLENSFQELDLGRSKNGPEAVFLCISPISCPVTHALNDGLVGLLIPAVAEGWILSSQLVQGFAQLVRILLGGWLAADLDTTGSLRTIS